MKVKVCGMQDKQNLENLVELSPDFIGFIFYPPSARYVGQNFDPAIARLIPLPIQRVGVFVNEDSRLIVEKAVKYGLDYVQLHGNETPGYCREIASQGLNIIKAFSISDAFDFSLIAPYEEYCSYILFDTKTEKYGGSGKKFNWSVLQKYQGKLPVFLSGGIGVEDAGAIRQLAIKNLFAVDINTRFEARPGFKDIQKVKNFIEIIR